MVKSTGQALKWSVVRWKSGEILKCTNSDLSPDKFEEIFSDIWTSRNDEYLKKMKHIDISKLTKCQIKCDVAIMIQPRPIVQSSL